MQTKYTHSWTWYPLKKVALQRYSMVQEPFEKHNNGLKILNCPPNSPDLGPIKYLWGFLDKQVQSKEIPPHK